jgi:hypothetical protein
VPVAERILKVVQLFQPGTDPLAIPGSETLGLVTERLDLAAEGVQRSAGRIVRFRDGFDAPAGVK